jgi:NADH-quinone oxidoreductase E subunit
MKSELEKQMEAQSRSELPDNVNEFIDECLKKPHPHSYLIDVLHMLQDKFGYLDNKKLEAVAQLLQIPAAKVSGVASFYHFFRLKPRGKYVISVCLGTACHVKGADKVVEKIEEELGIKVGETTKDGLFTLEEARCLGMCALAPVLKIEEDIHAQVTPDQVPAILERYINKSKE